MIYVEAANLVFLRLIILERIWSIPAILNTRLLAYALAVSALLSWREACRKAARAFLPAPFSLKGNVEIGEAVGGSLLWDSASHLKEI